MKVFYWTGTDNTLVKNLIANIRIGVSLNGNISPTRTFAELKLSCY